MRIAIASGKGGTGKTTVASNLAFVARESGRRVTLVDCDVEEPNLHIFMHPRIENAGEFALPVPVVDEEKCTGCGKCDEACQFSAIVVLGRKVVTFYELCHSCGGCTLACPEEAITEKPRKTGAVEEGDADGVRFLQARLNVGEPMATPLIRELKRRLPEDGLSILDSPPGTACSVIESVKGADYLLLVTEPTPFGLHDLTLAVGMARALSVRTGVVINRADSGDGRVRDYCRAEGLELLLEIPDDRRVAESYSRGELAAQAVEGYRERFEGLLRSIEEKAR